MTVEPIIREDVAEEFALKMLGHLTGSAVALVTSIGHRTGLFDLMAEIPPSTSEEIAAEAGLDERYVREWLAALVTADIVRYRAETRQYLLPPEHAAALTRKAGSNNLGSLARMMSGMGSVETELLEAFRNGGGLKYEAYEGFHEAMSELGDPVRELALARLSSLSHLLVQRLKAGIEVLDLGCGRGFVPITMAQRYPRSRFVGYDFSEENIEYANQRVAELGLENVRFELRDAATFEDSGQYGLITTFDAIHDQAYPAAVLDNIHRALKDGGFYLMVEPAASSHLEKNLDHPLATILYTVSCFHCMSVSLGQDGTGLGTMWGRELATQMLSDAGFRDLNVSQIDGDMENDYFLSRK